MPEAITFDEAANYTGGFYHNGYFVRTATSYKEDGFIFTSPFAGGGSYVFADWGHYMGVGSNFHASSPVKMVREDGNTFGVRSLEVKDFGPNGTIKFFGKRQDGTQVELTYTTSDHADGKEVVVFPEGFTSGLREFWWQEPTFTPVVGRVTVDTIVFSEPPNSAPTAKADAAAGSENGLLTIDVLANDTDVNEGDVLTLISAAAPEGKGAASVRDGKLTFDPGTAFDHLAEGATEVVTLTYKIRDSKGLEASATVTVTLTGTNDGPVARPDRGAAGENAPVILNVLLNDSDADDGAVLTIVSAAAPAGKGAAAVIGGKLQFTPGSDFDHLAEGATGTVTLIYVISDEHGAQSTSQAVVTVTGTNDAPVAVADAAQGAENETLTIDVLDNDADVDDGAERTLVSASGPDGKGSVAIVGGKLVFSPGAAFDHLPASATEVVVLSYTMQDQHGAQSTSQVVVTVTGTNDAPVAAADAAQGAQNETLTIDVLANDADVDAGAVRSLVSASAPEGKGSASVAGGKLVFAPGSDFDHLAAGATEVVVLSYRMQDEHGAVSSSTVTVTLTGTNDAPVAVADVQTAIEDGAAVFGNVLGNDSDVDAGARLSVSAVSFGATAGAVGTALSGLYGTLTLQADGTYTYTADSDLLDTLTIDTGLTDVFTYEVSDGQGGTHSAFLEIQVSLADDARTTTGARRTDVLLGDQESVGAEDTIYGLTGADTIDGLDGADWLCGGEGHDVVRGGRGRDTLFGDAGSDTLDGGDGDDRLAGGGGGDVLTGGSGRDVFVFEPNGGSDLVTDFEVGVDRIELIGVRVGGLTHTDLDGNGVLDGLLQLDDSFVVLMNVGAVGIDALLG